MEDFENQVQAEEPVLQENETAAEAEKLPQTEEASSGEPDEMQMLWEQLNKAREQLAEKDAELEQMQKHWEAAMQKCREEAQQVHFEDRLELELWKAGAKNPRAVRALLQVDAAMLSEDGGVKGLSEQLTALRQSDSYLFVTPAAVGTKGNFVRPRESVQNQSLKDAIASYYFG